VITALAHSGFDRWVVWRASLDSRRIFDTIASLSLQSHMASLPRRAPSAEVLSTRHRRSDSGVVTGGTAERGWVWSWTPLYWIHLSISRRGAQGAHYFKCFMNL